MFYKLKKRIYNSIFLLSLIFAITVSVISYVVIISNLYDLQVAKSNSNCSSAVKMTSTYITQVMSFVENTASQSMLSEAILGNDYDVSNELNRLCNYSVKIDGATLYGFNGYMAYSAEMGAPPTLDELLREADIMRFIESDEQTHISIRTDNVADVYNRTYYNSENGVISCMSKIYSDGEVCGILVSDLLPETLFSSRLLYNSFGEPCHFVIQNGEDILNADADVRDIISNGSAFNGYYITSRELMEGSTLQMYVSKGGYIRQCFVIFAAMLAYLFLLIFAVSYLAKRISRNAVAPLEKLNRQMNMNIPHP
ncbi:MAG: hypothetical protein ACI3XL_05880 [Eubacteriales bacterium]